jgi:metallo-beta-lactamase class B
VLGLLSVTALHVGLTAWGGPFFPHQESIFGRDAGGGLGLTGSTNAGGSLDKEIIRRIIRRHVDEVKACYEPQLALKPGLAGRIMVQFTIAASGQVVSSVLQHSTMANEEVERCTVAAVRSWQFPKPIGGGVVIVSYPFVLSPAGTVVPVDGKDSGGAPEVTRLGHQLYLHRSTDAKGTPSNGLVVATDRGLLLVDTAWTDEQTEAILRWGDDELHVPWIGAVITHEHADRDGGLAALQRRHIPTAALDLTVAKLEARGVRGVTALFAARNELWKDPRGFEAFYPGPGHAPDNIVLRFPTAVFGGCLVKSLEAKDLGFTGDADLRAWPEAIRKVRARYGNLRVVPGHGPVDPTAKAYEHTLELLGAAVTLPAPGGPGAPSPGTGSGSAAR